MTTDNHREPADLDVGRFGLLSERANPLPVQKHHPTRVEPATLLELYRDDGGRVKAVRVERATDEQTMLLAAERTSDDEGNVTFANKRWRWSLAREWPEPDEVP